MVLNHAHAMGGNSFFAVANAALRLLEFRADAVVRSGELAERLDWSRLPEDSSEFLMRVTRHGQAE